MTRSRSYFVALVAAATVSAVSAVPTGTARTPATSVDHVAIGMWHMSPPPDDGGE